MALELSEIEALLCTEKLGRPADGLNELWDAIDSTNARCLTLAKSGRRGGTMVLAREQTAGRGRHGRSWVSPPDAGIYLSFLIEVDASLSVNLPVITIAVGLACAEAAQATLGIRLGIKWVNDLILEERKVGGILCELTIPGAGEKLDGANRMVVVGIGVNVFKPKNVEVPEELANKMTWLSEAAGGEIDVNAFVAAVALRLEETLRKLANGEREQVLNGWRKFAITLGERVSATVGDDTFEGDAVDIDERGGLMVRTASGIKTLNAGEISVRRADGSYC